MSHRLNFLCFETQAASSGGFTIQLQSIDALSNTIQTLSVTGINAGDNEVRMANTAFPQINTQLIQYGLNYSGSPQFTSNSIVTGGGGGPIFSSQLGLATWRVTWSEHILCFFSEANFLMLVVANTTGSSIISNPDPLLCTVEDAINDGPIAGLILEDLDGNPLTTSQIITLVTIASSKLIAILNNRIVMCTFIHEDSGYWQQSFFLRDGLPGVYYDGVRVKRPYSVSLFGTLIGDSTSVVWNYNRQTGELNYIPSQNLVNTFEPSAKGNEIKISYVAGNFLIPSAITAAVLSIMTYILENKADVSKLKTGSFEANFKDKAFLDRIREELVNYIIW